MNLAQKSNPDKRLRSFAFRGNAPAFVKEKLKLFAFGDGCSELEARNAGNALIQTANAMFEGD